MLQIPLTQSRRNASSPDFSPSAILQELECEGQIVFVVRDDLLPGGTKQRACAPFLRTLAGLGYGDFYYASPFAGFAQVALSYVCSQMDLRCHLYCERDQTALGPVKHPHQFTRLAESYGANIQLTESLEAAEEQCVQAARHKSGVYVVPLGFNCEEFKSALETVLRRQWVEILEQLDFTPKNLWVPVGSGTLVSVFKRFIDPAIAIQAVNVHVLKGSDARIRQIATDSRVTLYSAPEEFHDLAGVNPNIPSNCHYDAKLWRFLKEYAQNGDVWWNVAR